MYYSKTTGGFYPASMRGDYEAAGTWPDDAVEITDSDEVTIRAGLATGGTVTGTSGAWIITPPAPPAIADLKTAAITQVRSMRVNVFAILGGIQSQALSNGDAATARAISGLQDQLKALPDIDLSGCQSQADIDSAFTAAWAAIVKAAPANVASAFNGLVTL